VKENSVSDADLGGCCPGGSANDERKLLEEGGVEDGREKESD
jgi:hypothetical protein